MGLQDKNTDLHMSEAGASSANSWSEISGKYASAPPDDGALPQIAFDDTDSDLSVEPEESMDNLNVSGQGISGQSVASEGVVPSAGMTSVGDLADLVSEAVEIPETPGAGEKIEVINALEQSAQPSAQQSAQSSGIAATVGAAAAGAVAAVASVTPKVKFNLKQDSSVAEKVQEKSEKSKIGSAVFEDSIIDIDHGFAKKQAQLKEDVVVVDGLKDHKEAAKDIDPTHPTILIVDDSKEILNKHAQIFLNADYNVITAHDGLEGLDKATKLKPELIFTGIIMPRMDGFSMIEGMRKNSEIMHTPVVITSHLGRAQDKVRAQELDVHDFIVTDSIPADELVARAHSILTVKEYSIPIDLSLPEHAGLLKDLGGMDKISCPEGKNHVLRISVDETNDMRISGRVECA